mmetsp:Transcript_4761/g.12039  ORF Transcript_4761/g.12039 Transcript_4761/m.12039 type:complete len:202 (+) Transcript_4761:52-657(+)|eukprot:CAMPEP_0195596942 /NCGR_PEP_ID=MMETSP0815-20121206/2725_1 /TAXON_ID=97485 /ORGANISM="Prymnesium parvum, Strain Texoma1" /LENGTH=201 /DNA_ID=CAMNT_0040736259 /DNA_START=3 /DNA_END=608 /DNA_ORIENTATION=-
MMHAQPARARLPAQVEGLQIDAVAAGIYHTVLVAQGAVCTFGDNALGQLGLANANRRAACRNLSAAVGAVVQVSAGEMHTLALTDAGEVLSWGSNLQRQCGRNFDEPLLTAPGVVPLKMEEGERVVRVHAGGYRGALVTNTGRLLMLGVGAEHEEQLLDQLEEYVDGQVEDGEDDWGGRAPEADVDVEPDNFDDDDEHDEL